MRLLLVLSSLALAGCDRALTQEVPAPAGAPQSTADPGPRADPDVTAAVTQLQHGQRAQGLQALERLARQGRPGAAGLLQGMRAAGLAGGPSDLRAACASWREAGRESAEALHFAAECAERGWSGPADLAEAAGLYERAAAGGFAKSSCALGNLYMNGRGVPRDVRRGVSLCRRAAEAGDPDAQADLGNVYLTGAAGPRDPAEARRWYERAAAQGHANAAMTLGQIYWNGDGVGKDNAQAARLWRIAYEGGRRDAALMLGDEAFVRLTQAPRPEQADPAVLREAMNWYEIAARSPEPRVSTPARERLAMLTRLRDALAVRGR